MPEIETLPRRSTREELCLLMGRWFLLNPIIGEFKFPFFSFLQACPVLGLRYDSGRDLLSGPFHNQEASAEYLSKIKDAEMNRMRSEALGVRNLIK